MDAVAGTAGNDTINAPATSPTTGANATTINSGDVVAGGAGDDTLNITISATNNNSLTGLTVSGVETVNISGTNNLGTSSPALAAAQAAKVTTAATLATKQAEGLLASQQAAAAAKVKALTDVGANDETAVAVASTVSATTASGQAAAAKAIAALSTVATITEASIATSVPTGATTYTVAQYNAAALAALRAEDGTAITVDATAAARAVALSAIADAVEVAVLSAGVTDLVASQQLAAATAIAGLGSGTVTVALLTAAAATTDAQFTALNTTAFTKAQYVAAANAALKAIDGSAITVDATADARADALVAQATAVAASANDYTVAQLNAAAVNATKAADGSTLLTPGNDSTAIAARAVSLVTSTAAASTAADTATAAALAADLAAANSVTVALAGVTATSVSAATFADATQIWLSGESNKTNVTGVAATQTIGFDGVSSLDSSVTFGATVTSGSIATKGASGALSVTGNAMTTLSISGTGTGATGLTITDAGTSATTGLDPVKTLNVNTSGSTVLNVSAVTELTSLTQSGAGGVTLTASTKLASVTTGEGADLIKLVTATAVDNPGTTVVETVSASLNSGGGSDNLVVATTGTGTTTVDAGAGNDTIYVNTLGSGANSISGGDGNDTIRIAAGSGLITGLQGVKIDGGSGTDTLRVANTGFTASDYTVLSANVSGIETLQLSGVVAAGATVLDASKIAMSTIDFRGEGNNNVVEVSSSQSVLVARTAAASVVTGFIDAVAAANPTGLTIASKGYVLDNDAGLAGNQTVFGDNLKVTLQNTAAATSVAATGNVLSLGVSALAQTGTAGASSAVPGISTVATVTGNLQGIDATLTSARGSGTNGAGVENTAGLTVAMANNNLQNLTSLKVSGSGVVVIGTGNGSIAALDVKLTTVDLSAMTALTNQNTLGQEWDGTTVGAYQNLSTATVTLNDAASETVKLGGALDTVVTGSTVVKTDTIEGFQLTASVADPLVADLARSDRLDITGFTGGVKMVTTASSLNAALLEAANYSVGGVAKDSVVFHFGGNTYVYVDNGAAGLSDNDALVALSGTLNLDLLISNGVII